MRIAHFLLGRCNPESANGVDKTVYHLSRAQASLGHDVAVFSITAKPALPIDGVDVRPYRPRFGSPAALPPVARDLLVDRSPFNLPPALVADLLGWRPDVVHLHFVHIPQNVVLGARLRRRRIPYCVTTHGALAGPAQNRRRLLKTAFATLVERRHLERASFIHAVSEADADGVRRYGVSNDMVVARNGVDMSSVRPSDEPDALGRLFPDSAGRRVFMFLGRLDPDQKGLDLLLRAWSLAGVGEEAMLVLVGPDWRGGRRRLERLASSGGLRSSVRFAGPVFGQQKWNLLAGADVLVHPSRWEAGIPFSVCEGMAAAKPVLVTRAADPERLVEQWRAGLVAEAEPGAIASAVVSLAACGRAELAESGARGRDLIVREFAWDTIAGQVVDGYRRHALAGHPYP